MGYLFLSVMFSSAITLFLKYGQKMDAHQSSLTFFNYISATVTALILCVINGSIGMFGDFSLAGGGTSFLQNIKGVHTPQGSLLVVLFLGLVSGAFYLLSIVLMQDSIKKNGVSMTSMFGRAGVLVPIILSVLIWKEIPGVIAIVGIVFSLVAMVIACYDGTKIRISQIDGIILLMIVSNGLGGFLSKLSQKFAAENVQDIYVFATFFVALILSYFMGKKEGKIKWQWKNIAIGAIVGFSNMASSVLFIKALIEVPAVIVFPVAAAGSLIVIAALSALLFKERLRQVQKIAIALTAIGVVLINL